MSTSQYKKPEWRKIYIRCDAIEDRYGSGNFDDAADDFVGELREFSEYPEQYYSCSYLDTSQSNPWYHIMIFEFMTFDVRGISDAQYEQFFQRIIALGLDGAWKD